MSDAALEAILAAIPPGAAAAAVTGEGPLAQALRARLPGPPRKADSRPDIVVETSGEAGAIAAALARVADLGTVVLAGPISGDLIALDLYGDLHVRGLTVVAVAPPDGGALTP